MSTTTASASTSTALAAVRPVFTESERLALAGYRGLTREAYTLDLRQFTGWCRGRSLSLFAVRRPGIETFARDLEARGRARVAWSGRVHVRARDAEFLRPVVRCGAAGGERPDPSGRRQADAADAGGLGYGRGRGRTSG
jgi:hypothetical protein